MGVQPLSLIEGDYIETVEGLLFAVKGLFHPDGRVIAYLRYVPDTRGDRRRREKQYRRVYNLEETTEFLQKQHPQYLSHVESLGLTLQTVQWDRVIRVYKPRERLRALMVNPRTELEKAVARFAFGLSSESGVPLEEFGVSGSVLIGLASPSSDIDLIVYGREMGWKAYEALRRLRETCEWVSSYDEVTIGRVLKARWGDTGLDLERFRGIEVRKFLHGLACGREYFVRLVKRPEEAESEMTSKPLCKVSLRAVVAGAAESIFTPCTYQVKDCVLLDAPCRHEVSELMSFRGKFTEQATEGDIVKARGTLEEVKFVDRTVYRVVMGARGDYLLPIETSDR